MIYFMAGYISGLLTNFKGNMNTWIGIAAVIAGLVMMLVGIVKVAKGLMSHGGGQVNWVTNILLLVIGGLLATSGFSAVSSFAGNVGADLLTGGTGESQGSANGNYTDVNWQNGSGATVDATATVNG